MNNEYLLGAGYYPAKLTKLLMSGLNPDEINEAFDGQLVF